MHVVAGCYGISVISLIQRGAVPNSGQQVVLCVAERRAGVEWGVGVGWGTVASPEGNQKGIFKQNQDSCCSFRG